VVDDGSTDNSLHGIQAKNIKIYRQSNQGPAAARNLGVEKAKGKIILFTDADCEPTKDWIEQMAKPLDDPSISGVKGTYLTRQKGLVAQFVQVEYESKYRKMEDQEFSFRMWEKGYRMVFNPQAKVYHTHTDSLLGYVKKKFRIGFWKALVLKEHPEKVVRDSHTPQSLKLEMVFSTLFLISLFLSPFHSSFLFLTGLSAMGFLTTITPFWVRAFRSDFFTALFSPFLLFLRSVSLSSGLMIGTLKFFFQKQDEKTFHVKTELYSQSRSNVIFLNEKGW